MVMIVISMVLVRIEVSNERKVKVLNCLTWEIFDVEPKCSC